MEKETTIKITKRSDGYTALVTYAWGAKVRLLGYTTREDAEAAAHREIRRKQEYTLDKEINLSSAAARALGSIRSEKKAASSRENGKKGGRPKKEK